MPASLKSPPSPGPKTTQENATQSTAVMTSSTATSLTPYVTFMQALTLEPDSRPSIAQLLLHPWVVKWHNAQIWHNAVGDPAGPLPYTRASSSSGALEAGVSNNAALAPCATDAALAGEAVIVAGAAVVPVAVARAVAASPADADAAAAPAAFAVAGNGVSGNVQPAVRTGGTAVDGVNNESSPGTRRGSQEARTSRAQDVNIALARTSQPSSCLEMEPRARPLPAQMPAPSPPPPTQPQKKLLVRRQAVLLPRR